MRRPSETLKCRHYAKNRDRILREAKLRRDASTKPSNDPETVKKIQERRRSNRLFFLEKLGGKCVDCGSSGHPSVLQFDHVDRSKKAVTHMGNLFARVRREDIWKEVQKCVLRCANCHWVKSVASGDFSPRKKLG